MMRTMSKISAMGLGLFALAAFSGGDLHAQDGGGTNAIFPVQPDPVISLEFAGGSLAEFAAALRKAGEGVNIVMPALAAEVDLPALALSQTTVESALKSIDAVIGEDFNIRVKTLRSAIGKPVYAVSVHKRNTRKSGASTQVVQMGQMENDKTRVAVLSLKFLTSIVPGDIEDAALIRKAETILSAVDTGLGIHSGTTKPEFRYHEDSGLLFIKGSSRELNLVLEIVRNLENDVRRLREASKLVAAMKRIEERQATKGK